MVYSVAHEPPITKTIRKITKLSATMGADKNANTIFVDCWKIFFPADIIISIVECTNR